MNVGILILVISIVETAFGFYLLRKWRNLLAYGKRATAVVVKNIRYDDAYLPVVKFLTDKQEWITRELTSRYTTALKDGAALEVIYDPDNPTRVEIYSTGRLKIVPRILVALGASGTIIGLLELLEIIHLTS